MEEEENGLGANQGSSAVPNNSPALPDPDPLELSPSHHAYSCLIVTPHTQPSSVPSYTPTPHPPSLGIKVYGAVLLCCPSG